MPHRDNFYSDEAHEIMGSVPSWTIRWGITVIFVIFAAIVAACWFIRYPETVNASVVITTSNPPSDLAARAEGLIERMHAENGRKVKKGDLIAVIANPADWSAVATVEENLRRSENTELAAFVGERWLDNEYSLGDIQSYYSELRRVSMDFRYYLEAAYIDRKISLLREQIAKSRKQYSQMQRQLALTEQEIRYEANNLSRDSMLFAGKVISQSDFEASASRMLQKKGVVESYKSSLTGAELSILASEQQIIELNIQKDSELENYRRQISQARQQLAAQINQWRQRYVIESPADGTISLSEYWSSNQWVRAGDIIATVIPDRPAEVTGRLYIPTAGLGKVADGQIVNIKLNGYPYMEFGMLKGTIKSISAVPGKTAAASGASSAAQYVAEVVFQNPVGAKSGYAIDLADAKSRNSSGEVHDIYASTLTHAKSRNLSEIANQFADADDKSYDIAGAVADIAYPDNAADSNAAQAAFHGTLRTTYGKEIHLIQRMDGTAEIITKERRLIQRFLDPIKALFDY